MTREEAINYVKENLLDENNTEALETLIPELKKSEDERMKELIIATINLYYGEPLEEEAKQMIAWLEKKRNKEDIHLMELKAKAYDDAKDCMLRAYRDNRVSIGFMNEIFHKPKFD